MSDVAIHITTKADLDDIQAAKKALTDFSSGGIQAVEGLKNRTIDLQKGVASLRVDLEANRAAQDALNSSIKTGTVSAQEGATMAAQLQQREAELNAELSKAQFSFRTASTELKALTREQSLANEQAQLLAAQFGVRLPEALAKLGTQIPGVQAALAAAFDITIFAAFAGAIGSVVIPALEKVFEAYRNINQASRDLLADIEKSNQQAIDKNPAALQLQLGNVNKKKTDLQRQLDDLLQSAKDRIQSPEGTENAAGEIIATNQQEEALRKQLNDLDAQALDIQHKITAELGDQNKKYQELVNATALVGKSESDRLRTQLEQAKTEPVSQQPGVLPGYASEKEKTAQIALLEAQLTEAIKQENDKRQKAVEQEAKDELRIRTENQAQLDALNDKGLAATRDFLAAQLKAHADANKKSFDADTTVKDETFKLQQSAALAGLDPYQQKVDKQKQLDQDVYDHLKEELDAGLISEQRYNDDVVAYAKISAGKLNEIDNERAQAHGQLLDRVSELDQQAADGAGNKYAAQLARITADEQKQFDELEKMYGKDRDNYAALQQAKTDLELIAQQKRNEVIDQYAQQLESGFNSIIQGAHNLHDVLTNIWKDLEKQFEDQVFKMIAAWLLGNQQMARGAQAGSTGILGSVFGGSTAGGPPIFGSAGNNGSIFGGGGTVSPGIITNWDGGSSGGVALNEPLNTVGSNGSLILGGASSADAIGYGATSPSANHSPLAAALGLPPTTPIGNIFSSLQPGASTASKLGGIAAGVAIGAYGFQLNNPVARGLVTAAGGALTGAEIGSLIAPGIGTVVGAVIGGIAGGIASLFGHNKAKQHDADIENQGFAEIKQLLDDYEHFRRDYPSTADAMNQVHMQMEQNFQRSESKDNETYWYNQYIAQIQQIQDQRTARQLSINTLGVPEFDSGGFVWPGGAGDRLLSMWGQPSNPSGATAAWLHTGEFVMNRKAVNFWGVKLLADLNDGKTPAPATSGFTGPGGVRAVSEPPAFVLPPVSPPIQTQGANSPASASSAAGEGIMVNVRNVDSEQDFLDRLDKGIFMIATRRQSTSSKILRNI